VRQQRPLRDEGEVEGQVARVLPVTQLAQEVQHAGAGVGAALGQPLAVLLGYAVVDVPEAGVAVGWGGVGWGGVGWGGVGR
jgi:hypothetical protein